MAIDRAAQAKVRRVNLRIALCAIVVVTVVVLGRSVNVRIAIDPCCSVRGILILRASGIDTVPPSEG